MVFREETRGVFAGIDTDNLYEIKAEDLDGYDLPNGLRSGKASVGLDTTWENNGSIVLQQQYPLPQTILAVVPFGQVGG
jgi:hypothetical protein